MLWDPEISPKLTEGGLTVQLDGNIYSESAYHSLEMSLNPYFCIIIAETFSAGIQTIFINVTLTGQTVCVFCSTEQKIQTVLVSLIKQSGFSALQSRKSRPFLFWTPDSLENLFYLSINRNVLKTWDYK